jgi:hypothetical protein
MICLISFGLTKVSIEEMNSTTYPAANPAIMIEIKISIR